jgi:hypothetical protein
MEKFRQTILGVLIFCLLLSSASTGFAVTSNQPQNFYPSPDDWHFIIAPYIWTSAISGDFTVRDVSRHVYIPFSKILSHLDFAAMGYAEVGRGPISVMVDPLYLKVSQNVTKDSITAHVTSQTTLMDIGMLFRLFYRMSATGQYFSLELLGGGRFLSETINMQIATLPTRTDTRQLFPPIVGGRIKYSINPLIHFWAEGDVGGFNLDYVKNTWNTALGISFTVQRHIDLALAYRALGIDYSKRATSSMNTVLYGPLLGISFH